MNAADRAVLGLVDRQILRPSVIEAAIDRAVEKLLTDRIERDQHRARLTTRLETVEAELKRLTDAVAAGISVATLAEALGAREQERQRIREELAAARTDLTLHAEDRVRIRAELADLLRDWRDLLAQHVTQSRKILRKVLTKRLRFIAETRGGVAGYRVEAEGTLQPLFSGVVQSVASLTGFVPTDAPKARRMPEDRRGCRRPSAARELASLMPASWNHVMPWLRAVDELRRAA
jgi:hypothetical protein